MAKEVASAAKEMEAVSSAQVPSSGISSSQQFLKSKPVYRNFPLMLPWFAGIGLAGVGLYYGGRYVAWQKKLQMTEEVSQMLERMDRGSIAAEQARAEEVAAEIRYQEQEGSSWQKKALVGGLFVGSFGGFLYKNWDRSSVAMSLMKTRILGQAGVVSGIVLLSVTAATRTPTRRQPVDTLVVAPATKANQ